MDTNQKISTTLASLYENREKDWMEFVIPEIITPIQQRQMQTLFQFAKSGFVELKFPEDGKGFAAKLTPAGVAAIEGTLI
jgi:hypothetical protein